MPTPEKPAGRRGSKSMSDLREKFSNQYDGTGLDTAASSDVAGDTSSSDSTSPSSFEGSAGTEGSSPQSFEGGNTGESQGQASGVVSGIRQFVKDTTYEQLGNQKQRATEGLGSIAQAVRSATQPLRDSGQGKTADYINSAADQIEQFSGTLRERDLQDLLADLERFARRQPAVFIGTAFGLGVLAARFLKSSSQRGGPQNRGAQGSGSDRSSYGSDRSMSGSSSGYGGSAGSYSGGSAAGSLGTAESAASGSTLDIGS